MGNMSGSYGSHYTLTLDAYVLSQDIANNKSTIRADLWLDFDGSSYYAYTSNTTYGNIRIHGSQSNKSVASISFTSGVASRVYLGTYDVEVPHYNDGTCPAILVEGYWDTNTTLIGSGATSTSVTPPTIPRYATITTFSVAKRDNTSVTVTWGADANCDAIWYSTNNGSSWIQTSGYPNFNITGLSANTTYNFKIKVRRSDSQLTTISNTVQQTTYPNTIPTISLSSKTINSITVTSGCNVTVSSTQYRIKKGSGSYGSYQNSATFSNLEPNTSYTIEVKKVSTAGSITGTATLNVTTYQKATLNAVSNINHRK